MKAVGFYGASGSGKTTLIERLIARFAASGLRVAAVKHAHHGFDIDRPGKDSFRFRAAGADQVLLASDARWALLSEETDPAGDAAGALARQLARLAPCDLVLVEGFRGQAGIPFLEVRCGAAEAAVGGAGAAPVQLALVVDAAGRAAADAGDMPVFERDDIDAIAGFIARTLELAPW